MGQLCSNLRSTFSSKNHIVWRTDKALRVGHNIVENFKYVVSYTCYESLAIEWFQNLTIFLLVAVGPYRKQIVFVWEYQSASSAAVYSF